MEILNANAKKQSMTKVDYIVNLLHGNEKGRTEEVEELNKLVKHQNVLLYELNDKTLAKENKELTIAKNEAVIGLETCQHGSLKLVQQGKKKTANLNGLKELKTELEELQHKEYDCMMITSKCTRCKSNGLYKAIVHGMEINVCGSHRKQLQKQKQK